MLHSLFLIGSFGTTEILLIVFVIILLFGAKRIPELFRGMGQGVREFKDATKQEEPQFRDQPQAPTAGQQAPSFYPGQQGQSAPQAPNFYPPQAGQPAQPQAPNFYPNDPNQPRQ
jgi:TatA/E family protein of Tat protein translocase